MEDPEALHNPAATVQYGFHKKVMKQHAEKILYTKSHALQHYMELAERAEHPRFTGIEFMSHMAKTATEVYA